MARRFGQLASNRALGRAIPETFRFIAIGATSARLPHKACPDSAAAMTSRCCIQLPAVVNASDRSSQGGLIGTRARVPLTDLSKRGWLSG